MARKFYQEMQYYQFLATIRSTYSSNHSKQGHQRLDQYTSNQSLYLKGNFDLKFHNPSNLYLRPFYFDILNQEQSLRQFANINL
ncbi:hypothetical protein TTHERM_002653499 (macronuclear) [Tetrahymena thermophila SB210]|uniref:Uncharacterized protein n=1 Tax=Tetrahymena thermophila (strain SB210) TaxID=312017 RepID=W7XKS6_TETTS|nr:hypothetical protein TTHERM_002653499 [Tetrahymena thermophila SB210]EWS76781.1 hypothetical protein TTHERM_002653499 [Tetrahymena thermophila SB210]|eukprot:XP_012650683.1 hypothetical protein TTHERM_002653499 [Tetrahymena thermophila SB210]